MRIDIRSAVVSDIEGMSEVVDSAWRVNYRDIFDEETIAAFTGERRRKSFAQLLDNGADIFVLTVDMKITAVCAAVKPESNKTADIAEILLLYVTPEFQRTGQGRKLLSHTLRKMREKGYSGAVLSTAEKNIPALEFYRKFGFTKIKTREYNGVSYVDLKIDF
ncbi:MAG: GNAT family N-acetyltransferase [Oscillospiraceae bacterium]|nr:GNAT family N-acetyltransferase [Oscillospiraceae bacterium]